MWGLDELQRLQQQKVRAKAKPQLQPKVARPPQAPDAMLTQLSHLQLHRSAPRLPLAPLPQLQRAGLVL